jgi:hypothetical protein
MKARFMITLEGEDLEWVLAQCKKNDRKRPYVVKRAIQHSRLQGLSLADLTFTAEVRS